MHIIVKRIIFLSIYALSGWAGSLSCTIFWRFEIPTAARLLAPYEQLVCIE